MKSRNQREGRYCGRLARDDYDVASLGGAKVARQHWRSSDPAWHLHRRASFDKDSFCYSIAPDPGTDWMRELSQQVMLNWEERP